MRALHAVRISWTEHTLLTRQSAARMMTPREYIAFLLVEDKKRIARSSENEKARGEKHDYDM